MESIVILVVIGTSIWVLCDAISIGVKKGQVKGFGDMGPVGWFFACLLLWIVGFPLYLAKRSEFKIAQQRETSIGERNFAAPLPPPPPATFYIYLNDQVQGPFSHDQLQAILAVNTVSLDTSCCRLGTQEWLTIRSFI